MGRKRVSNPAPGDHRRGHPEKAAIGLRVIRRGRTWYLEGTVRVAGDAVRVRESLGLPAEPETRELAEQLRHKREGEIRTQLVSGAPPAVSLAVAALQYLERPRSHPPSPADISIIKHLVAKLGTEDLAKITQDTWTQVVEARALGLKAESRERIIATVLALLHWCQRRRYLAEVPSFERDPRARNPNRRARRRVRDLDPDLVELLLRFAAPHLKGQLAVELSSGARVSSVLHGAKLADLDLTPQAEQITFFDTKNGDTVTAALHPVSVRLLQDYLVWRGQLWDREAPLFLTHRRQPYRPGIGTQNGSAFNGAKQRAIAYVLAEAEKAAAEALRCGDRRGAAEIRARAGDRTQLIGQITQHWLRHRLASALLREGADIRTVMAQGGWRDPRSVIGYTHDVPDHRRQMVNRLPLGKARGKEGEDG